MGLVHLSSVSSPQTPQQVFHSGLRRSESSQRKSSRRRTLELKVRGLDGELGTICAVPWLSWGFPGALPRLFGVSGFGFWMETLESVLYTKLGHRKCIHTCPGQPGTSQVSDVLLGRVELRGCDDEIPSCSQINKPPPPPWHWAFPGHALMAFPWADPASADTGG